MTTPRNPLRVLRSAKPTTLVIVGWSMLATSVAGWYAASGDYLPALLLTGVAATHSVDIARAIRDHRGAR